MDNRQWLSILALSVSVMAWQPHAFAQSAPADLGTGQTPNAGQLLQDLQQKTVPTEELQPNTQRQKAPEAEVEDQRNKKPATQEGQEDSEPVRKVFIRKIEVEGAESVDQEAIQARTARYENKDNSFSELQALTEELTELYRQKGLVTSRIYIPPQKLQNGVLTLKAIEGKMGKLVVNPGKYYKQQSVTPYVLLDRGELFDIDDLKLTLRRLNENPDRNVRAVLKPGEAPGETDVQMDIFDRRPFHISPSFDNLGRNVLGNNRVGLRTTHNNLIGYGDTFLNSLSFTRKSFGMVNHYEIPITKYGTRLGFDHAYSNLELGGPFGGAQIKGTAVTYSPSVTQDLINRERYRLYLDVAFDFKELDTDFAGQSFSHDALRILRPALNFEQYDRFGRTFLRNEFGIGLDVFGGSDGVQRNSPLTGLRSASRATADSTFFRYTGSLIRTQRMPWNSFGIFRVLGQLTPDALVSAEQFQVGGAFTVRGYREGRLIGDQGLLLSAEWRTPFFLAPKTFKLPGSKIALRDAMQFVSFVDYGMIRANAIPTVPANSEQILGVGVGLRLRMSKYLTGRMDVGFPLLRQDSDVMTPRIHFGLESEIL